MDKHLVCFGTFPFIQIAGKQAVLEGREGDVHTQLATGAQGPPWGIGGEECGFGES